MPLLGRLTLTAFPNYIFVYAQRQWFSPVLLASPPAHDVPVAHGRLIARADTAGRHKSYNNSVCPPRLFTSPGVNQRTMDLIRRLCTIIQNILDLIYQRSMYIEMTRADKYSDVSEKIYLSTLQKPKKLMRSMTCATKKLTIGALKLTVYEHQTLAL